MLLTVPAAITAAVLPALEDEVTLAEEDRTLADHGAWASRLIATAQTLEDGTLILDVPEDTEPAVFDDICALHEGPDRTGLCDYASRIGWLQLAQSYQVATGGPTAADLRTLDEQQAYWYTLHPEQRCRHLTEELRGALEHAARVKAADDNAGRGLTPEWEAAHAESCVWLDVAEEMGVPTETLDALVQQAQGAGD